MTNIKLVKSSPELGYFTQNENSVIVLSFMSPAYGSLYQISIVSAREVVLHCIIFWTMSACILTDDTMHNMRHSDIAD